MVAFSRLNKNSGRAFVSGPEEIVFKVFIILGTIAASFLGHKYKSRHVCYYLISEYNYFCFHRFSCVKLFFLIYKVQSKYF